MRLSRLATLVIAFGAVGACGKDNVTDPSLPPLAGVRFINGLSDSSSVDVRMIDQVSFSFEGLQNIAFRSGSEHQPVEAKARHIRVFPNSFDPAITSAFMVDTTITFAANSQYTLLLTRENPTKVHLVVIDDNVPAPPAGQISIRLVNASTGAIDAYVVDSTVTPIAPPAAATNVAPLATSSYVSMAVPTKAAVRVTAAGSGTVAASQQGPRAAATPAGENPAAAVNNAGTAFSVYYFPRSVAGTSAPQTAAFTNPAVVWFVDRNPADK